MTKIYGRLATAARGIKTGFSNLIYWLPVIWQDRWWDWYFLARIIEHKALRDAPLYRTRGCAEESEGIADELENLAARLRFLMEDGDENMDFEANEAALTECQRTIGDLFANRLNCWWD